MTDTKKYYYPCKILPWGSLVLTSSEGRLCTTGKEIGYIPVYSCLDDMREAGWDVDNWDAFGVFEDHLGNVEYQAK